MPVNKNSRLPPWGILGLRKAYILTDIFWGPYYTLFAVAGGCKLATMKKLRYHRASTCMSRSRYLAFQTAGWSGERDLYSLDLSTRERIVRRCETTTAKPLISIGHSHFSNKQGNNFSQKIWSGWNARSSLEPEPKFTLRPDEIK